MPRSVVWVLGLSLVMGLALWPGAAAAAEVADIPGTKVRLQVPHGFAIADNFTGLMHAEMGASVMVMELEGSASEMQAGLTAARMAREGMTLLNTEPVQVAGMTGTLFHVTQSAGGAMFRKYLLVFGNDRQIVQLVATTPKAYERRMGSVLRQVLLTAVWQPKKVVDLWEGLPFTIQETPALVIQSRMLNMLMLERPGQQQPVPPEEPLLVVTQSLRAVTMPDDLAEHAKLMLTQIKQVRDIANVVVQATTLDGLPAHELVADARDKNTGVPVKVYQVVAFEGPQYFRLLGLVGLAKADQYLPEFRKITASFKRR